MASSSPWRLYISQIRHALNPFDERLGNYRHPKFLA
jgi:hypothetical protein